MIKNYTTLAAGLLMLVASAEAAWKGNYGIAIIFFNYATANFVLATIGG